MITNNKEKSSGQIFKLNVTNYDNGLFETRVAGSREDDNIKSNNDNYRENVLDKNNMTQHYFLPYKACKTLLSPFNHTKSGRCTVTFTRLANLIK